MVKRKNTMLQAASRLLLNRKPCNQKKDIMPYTSAYFPLEKNRITSCKTGWIDVWTAFGGKHNTHSAHVQFAICWQYIVGRSLFDTTSHEDVGPTSLAHTPTLWPNGLPWKVSVLGTIHMMGLAKRVKARILQASTSEIYGDPEAGLAIFFSESFQLYNSVMRRQRDIASESDGFRMAAAQNIFQRHRTYIDLKERTQKQRRWNQKSAKKRKNKFLSVVLF